MIYLFKNKKGEAFLCFVFKVKAEQEIMFGFLQFARMDFRKLEAVLMT